MANHLVAHINPHRRQGTAQCIECSYCACMPAITVRNVSQVTRDELAARAAFRGQSLQEYLSAALESMAAKPDLDQLLQAVRSRKAATGTSISAQAILDNRDADRR